MNYFFSGIVSKPEVLRIFALLCNAMTFSALTIRNAGRKNSWFPVNALWFTFPTGSPRREGIVWCVPIGHEHVVELSFLWGIFLACLGIFLNSGSLF